MTMAIGEVRRRLNVRNARGEKHRAAREEITVIGLKNEKAALAAMRTLLFTDPGTLASKAKKARCSANTLAKIRDGVTKHPRFSTLLGIALAYGFHVQLSDE